MRKITDNSKESIYQPNGFILINNTIKLSEVRSKQNYPMFALITASISVTYGNINLNGKIVNDLDYPVLICTPEKLVYVYNYIDGGDKELTSYASTNNFKILSPGEELNYDNQIVSVLAEPPNRSDYKVFFIVFF